MPLFRGTRFLPYGEVGNVNPVSFAQASGLLAQRLDSCIIGVIPKGLPEKPLVGGQTNDAIIRRNQVIMRIVRMIFGLPRAWFGRFTAARRHKTGGKQGWKNRPACSVGRGS